MGMKIKDFRNAFNLLCLGLIQVYVKHTGILIKIMLMYYLRNVIFYILYRIILPDRKLFYTTEKVNIFYCRRFR
jgi:hypothetical protein